MTNQPAVSNEIGAGSPSVEGGHYADAPVHRQGPDSVNPQWSRELNRGSLLSRTEEVALARRMRRGDEAARGRFIESNLKLVVSIAKRYRGCGVPMEDLIQEGNIGLMNAVDRFDPDRGCRFSTHAVLWIEGQIRRSLARLSHLLQVPLRMTTDLSKLGRATDELTQGLGRQPTAGDLANAMGAPTPYVETLLAFRPDPSSLDEPVEEDPEMCFGEVLEDRSAARPDDVALRREFHGEVRKWLHALPERHQMVLRLRFGFDGVREHTLQEIGTKFGLSRQGGRAIEKSALEQIRRLPELAGHEAHSTRSAGVRRSPESKARQKSRKPHGQ